MSSTSRFTSCLLLLVPLIALIPVARMSTDWLTVSRIINSPILQTPTRAYDWVVWQELDGLITAKYVFPRGPSERAGLQEGDVFYELDYQQYFNAEDLRRAIEGIKPGTTAVYSVIRKSEFLEIPVQFTQYPTFLYPFSSTLWQFGIWGFGLASFFHILALIIVGPLAIRSRGAMLSLLLISLSGLWMFGNLIRILTIEVLGPTILSTGIFETAFETLTIVGLIGLVGFPSVLLHKAINDTDLLAWHSALRIYLYLPALVLGLTVAFTSTLGRFGPVTRDALIAPILFYASCYVGTAAAILSFYPLPKRYDQNDVSGLWNRTGSLLTLIAAFFGAMAVLGIVPHLGIVTDTVAAWLIVGGQLLSVAPIILVTLATLQYGRVNQVLGRGISYLAVFGIIFAAYMGGFIIFDPYIESLDASRNLVGGLFVILLFLVFERLIHYIQNYTRGILTAERARIRQTLSRFQVHLRSVLDHHVLIQETEEAVSSAFGTRFTVLLITHFGREHFVQSFHKKEPPGLSLLLQTQVWSHFFKDGRVWARKAELNESHLSFELSETLHRLGVELAIPIMGRGGPVGILALGPKKKRHSVYNLEDLELLRALGGQLALAVERLELIEREKLLIKETAEAQLMALRAQINPHFLFNALNTIISLIEDKPQEAEAAVEHLSSIFRHVLNTGSQPFVTLEEEIFLVSNYLAIERSRFGSKLQTELRVEPQAKTHMVPAFALQTLVENAIKHGIEKLRGPGRLLVSCQMVEDKLEIVVEDNGVGIPELFNQPENQPLTSSFFGIGLQNVASRIERLYGRTDLLSIKSTPDEGTDVRLILPSFTPSMNEGIDTRDLVDSGKR